MAFPTAVKLSCECMQGQRHKHEATTTQGHLRVDFAGGQVHSRGTACPGAGCRNRVLMLELLTVHPQTCLPTQLKQVRSTCQ